MVIIQFYVHEEFSASIIDALRLLRKAEQKVCDNNQFFIKAGNRSFEIRTSICRFLVGLFASRIRIFPYFWINGTVLPVLDDLLLSKLSFYHQNHDFSFLTTSGFDLLTGSQLYTPSKFHANRSKYDFQKVHVKTWTIRIFCYSARPMISQPTQKQSS